MLQKEDTKLEIFGFGEQEDDTFYCLVNIKKNPDGIDLQKLSNARPRQFDEVLDRMGCILMLQGDEVEELIRREDITEANMHQGLYDLAVEEDFIK